MVDTGIRVDDELIRWIEKHKLIPRESCKSVLKRYLGLTKLKGGEMENGSKRKTN